ncbi:MAG: hypothetical protein KDJ86_06530 [Bauldia sp.]|uniref:hypothetical protein n=1 Tax=Bauldia sp. TaxID=2575872 RepID=UPI001D8EF290|nr:hypothetical protein [Bauldia sp.]MCB1495422.1 hypothetical protein [Bauldia sp.]
MLFVINVTVDGKARTYLPLMQLVRRGPRLGPAGKEGKMNTRIRQTIVAVTFSATVALGITGATLSGQTKETDLAQVCANATWPMIPAECLEGQQSDVRKISPDGTVTGTTVLTSADIALAERFQTAFQ